VTRAPWAWIFLGFLLAAPAWAEDPHLPPFAAPAIQKWLQDRGPALGVHGKVLEGPALLELELTQPTAQTHVLITPRPDDGNARGGELLPSLLVLTDPRTPPPELQPALTDLIGHLRLLDREPAPKRHEGPPGAPPMPSLLAVTWALLALSLLALPWAWRRTWQVFDVPRIPLIVLGLSPVLAWLLRALAPHRLVMVYFGWLHVDQAATLEQLPRYGAATSLLDHVWFQAFGVSPTVVQWGHTLLGAATVLPMAAIAARLVTDRRARQWTALGTALGIALLPLSILDHGTESMLVPAVLWWTCAVVLLQRFVRDRSLMDAGGAVILLVLCGLARPDAMLVAMPTAGVLLGVTPGASLRGHWRGLAVVAVLVLVLWLPGIQWLRERTAEDVLAGNLPHFGAAFLDRLPERFARGWVVLDQRYFPLAAAVLPLVAVLFPPARRPVLALGLVSLLWALPMLLDFNESSMLRLHAPSAMLWLAAGMVALGTFAATPLPARLPKQVHPMTIALVLVQLSADAVATVGDVFSPQLSDADDRLMAQVAHHSHDGKPATYVTRGFDDLPDQGIHLFQPQFALEPGDKWLSVRDFLRDEAGVHARGPVFAVQGARCHAGLPEQRKGWKPGQMHPACEQLCAQGNCRPLWTEAVRNVGERGFDWYPSPHDEPTFAIGLYAR
jgi:hypothetical protein